jgi:hypothetical protein
MSDDKLDPSFALESQAAVRGGDMLDSASSPPVKRSVEWAAGFADGEGCIYIFKQRYKNPRRKTSYGLGFCITQNHWLTLECFRLSAEITQTLSKVKPRPGLTRQVYTLNLTGKSALRLITLLHPYLVRKQLEAEAAFDYWQEAMGGKHPGRKGWSAEVIAKREHYFQKMRALK